MEYRRTPWGTSLPLEFTLMPYRHANVARSGSCVSNAAPPTVYAAQSPLRCATHDALHGLPTLPVHAPQARQPLTGGITP